METYHWKTEYNLGIDIIDAQHKQIVQYINDLNHAIEAQHSEEVFQVLEKLRDYCLDHFEFEEQLLKQAKYMLFEAHQNVHRRFKEKIDQIESELKEGKDPLSVARRVRTWLMSWLISHIQREDLDYVPYVKKILIKESNWITSALKGIFGARRV